MTIPDIHSYVFRNSMPSSIPSETVVLIDTHNFTTTAIEALSNGAEYIVPLNSLKGGISSDIDIIAGDESSDLRNHPADMSEDIVRNKVVGINSWNGTKATHAVRSLDGGNTIYATSLTNAPSVALELKKEKDITFILSGSNGNIPPEDVITMQCVYNMISADYSDIMGICESYEQFYRLLIKEIYGHFVSISDDGTTPFGNPENHAHEFASRVGEKTIIPTMNSENRFV